MSLSHAPYEVPDDRASAAEDPGLPPDTLGELGVETAEAVGTMAMPNTAGVAENVLPLVREVAEYERQVFEEALAGMYARFDERLGEATANLHDPAEILYRGILVGAGAVLLALVTLLALGALFLFAVRTFA